jgi:hypothetical protein
MDANNRDANNSRDARNGGNTRNKRDVDNRRDISIIIQMQDERDPNSSKYIDNSRVDSSNSRVNSIIRAPTEAEMSTTAE